MRIVIKIGTSTLAHPTGHLNIRRVEELCKVISDIKNTGCEVILVSSGAIGMGVGKLGLRQRPTDIPTKQAAAAVGQCELMYTYDKLFSEYHHTVAQLLITGDDIANEHRHQNFSNTLNRLLELGHCPSSTRMTPSPPQRSSSATTTPWPPSWPKASTPTSWCCFQTSTVFTPPIPTPIPMPS